MSLPPLPPKMEGGGWHHEMYVFHMKTSTDFITISMKFLQQDNFNNKQFFFPSTKMVLTKSQLENLSKEELIEELITFKDITLKLSDFSNQFDEFLRRF